MDIFITRSIIIICVPVCTIWLCGYFLCIFFMHKILTFLSCEHVFFKHEILTFLHLQIQWHAFIMSVVLTFPPCGYFHYMSLLCLWYLLFHHVNIFITCLYYICGTYLSTMWIFLLQVSIVFGVLTFIPCGCFPPACRGLPCGFDWGTYFSTMWIFSSSLPRTTLCLSSLKAAMIPFILSNIMAIFSPLQETWLRKTSLRRRTC